MFFHASDTPDLKTLAPHISNHGKPFVYLSEKRENVLVYLSNAVKKCCKEQGFEHNGVYTAWGPYGFNKEGILTLDEYYPNATEDTYKGVKGYIYSIEKNISVTPLSDIPFAFVSEKEVNISACEFVPDAYDALLEAHKQGKLIIRRYEENSEKMLDWICKTIKNEYLSSEDKPEYRLFLKTKFDFLKEL